MSIFSDYWGESRDSLGSPIQTLDAIVWGLGMLGRVSKRCAEKAEFARIGRYYATESICSFSTRQQGATMRHPLRLPEQKRYSISTTA